MSSIFCCDAIEPYRPQYLLHQAKFNEFISWALFPRTCLPENDGEANHDLIQLGPSYAVQLVQQVNYGRLESKRYFIPTNGTESGFIEVIENDLTQANFQKVNTYKNYKCQDHDKFFEVNIYQKDPINKHHWRVNIVRPADSIDL